MKKKRKNSISTLFTYIEKLNLIFSKISSSFAHSKDAIAKAINITSLAPSEEFIPTSISSDTSANKELKNNDDKDNGSDLRAADVEEYPAGWNFSMKVLESEYRTPVELPAEKTGHGVNRHVFFVCTDLNDEWMELPPATPHQINVSRRIKKYLTGDLDEAITSHPKFPGTEQNYLRALIARISCGAHLSPRSFHKIESNGIEGEETEADDNDHHASDDDDDATLSEFTLRYLNYFFFLFSLHFTSPYFTSPLILSLYGMKLKLLLMRTKKDFE